MRTLSNLKDLTILVWNVGGLTIEKLKDNKFKQILNKDIIFLIETNTDKDSKINLLCYIHSQSIMELKSKDCTKGSGGIVIYGKSKFAQNIEFIKSEHDDILWLKLKKSISIFKKIYFGAVYIVLSNSSSCRSKCIDADTFLILQKERSTFLGGHIILGGGGTSILDCKINLKIMLCQIQMIFYPQIILFKLTAVPLYIDINKIKVLTPMINL